MHKRLDLRWPAATPDAPSPSGDVPTRSLRYTPHLETHRGRRAMPVMTLRFALAVLILTVPIVFGLTAVLPEVARAQETTSSTEPEYTSETSSGLDESGEDTGDTYGMESTAGSTGTASEGGYEESTTSGASSGESTSYESTTGDYYQPQTGDASTAQYAQYDQYGNLLADTGGLPPVPTAVLALYMIVLAFALLRAAAHRTRG